MPKFAVCVPRHDILNIPYINWRVTLEDRAIVDDLEKINPELKQLLPYMTFWRFNRSLAVDSNDLISMVEVLTYRRDVKGDAPDLIGKLSIGFGGHVDVLPNEGEKLCALLTREALREGFEEIGVELIQEKLLAIIKNQLTCLPGIMLESDRTDAVHYGVPIFYNVDKDEQKLFDNAVPEAGHIKELSWVPLTSLQGDETNTNPQGLENWSVVSVQFLTNQILHS